MGSVELTSWTDDWQDGYQDTSGTEDSNSTTGIQDRKLPKLTIKVDFRYLNTGRVQRQTRCPTWGYASTKDTRMGSSAASYLEDVRAIEDRTVEQVQPTSWTHG